MRGRFRPGTLIPTMPRPGDDFASEEQGAATLRGTLHAHHVNPGTHPRTDTAKKARPSALVDTASPRAQTLTDKPANQHARKSRITIEYVRRALYGREPWRRPPNLTSLTGLPLQVP